MKKTSLFWLSLVLTAALLVSCAQPAPSATPTPTGAPAPAAKPTVAPTPTAVPPITLKVSGELDATSPHRAVLERAMKMITERSGGKVKFDYYPGEVLIHRAKAFTEIPAGLADMGMGQASDNADAMGAISWANNGLYNWDSDKFNANYRKPGLFFDFAQPYFEKMGLRLMTWPTQWSGDLIGHKLFKTLPDFKGVIIRSIPAMFEAVKLLGGAPVNVPTAEIYTALQQGTIEAVLQSAYGFVGYKYYEIAKKVTLTGFYCGSVQTVMNLNTWKKLTPELQQIFTQAFIDAEVEARPLLQAARVESVKELKAKGIEVYEVPAEELARWFPVLKPYYDGLAKKYGKDWENFEPIWRQLRPG